MKATFTIVCMVLGSLAMTTNSPAQNTAKTNYITKDNVAINGYDVVAYFTENKAVRGSQTFAAIHKGINYWFSSAENRTKFQAEPDKYLPQYGGWCAFAMAMKDAKVPSDPKTFKLYNGKLYLFFNDYYQGAPFNTIIPWNAAEANMKIKADANWNKMQYSKK